MQTPGSPQFHHWLTPEDFAARFGVDDADISAVEAWLVGEGFHVDSVSRSRDRITFSGTAAQVQRAFGAELHHYSIDGAVHFAPSSDLMLPAELGAMTAAVLHLSDFRPAPPLKTTRSVSPAYTDSSTGRNYLLPADIAVMYDFAPANTTPKSIQGNTQVAVVGQSFVNTLSQNAVYDFSTFANFGVSFPTVTPILVPGSGVEAISPGDEAESEIDLEYIDTAGETVNPFFVFVGDNTNYSVFDSLSYTIDENLAPVISISYGICEPLLSSTDLEQGNALFEQASAQGQTIVASAGDSGATACSGESTASGVTATERQTPAVNFPASSPYVTSVGGTQMAAGTFAAGNTQYWGTGLSGAGPAPTSASLLSYVPEVAWNEGSVSGGISAGGGGASSYFARPSWQTALPGIPGGSYRLLPDISLQSSSSNPGYVLCTDDPTFLAEEGQTMSCGNGLQGSDGTVTVGGGTSFAAPIFAGMVALLNIEEKAMGQGNINPLLYSLAATPTTYAQVFHDITTGTTSCVTGAAQCSSASQGDFATGPGYDEATGLGSVDFNAWAAAWPAAPTASLLTTETVILPSVSEPYTAGQNVSLAIDVGPSIFTDGLPLPTGAVSVAIDNNVVDAALAFTSGSKSESEVFTSYALVVPATTGYHLVTVIYPGDALHAPSQATYPFQVGSVEASGSFNIVAGNLTVANGGTGTTQITVTPGDGYSGEVMWSSLNVSGSSATTSLTACYKIAPLIINSVSSETLTLGVGSACSASSSYRKVQLGAAQKPQSGLPLGGIYGGLLVCGCIATRRRRWRGMPLLLLLGAALVGPMGCGGGGSSSGNSTGGNPPSTPSTPATTYTLALTGKDSVNTQIVSSATFTLTVD